MAEWEGEPTFGYYYSSSILMSDLHALFFNANISVNYLITLVLWIKCLAKAMTDPKCQKWVLKLPLFLLHALNLATVCNVS